MYHDVFPCLCHICVYVLLYAYIMYEHAYCILWPVNDVTFIASVFSVEGWYAISSSTMMLFLCQTEYMCYKGVAGVSQGRCKGVTEMWKEIQLHFGVTTMRQQCNTFRVFFGRMESLILRAKLAFSALK